MSIWNQISDSAPVPGQKVYVRADANAHPVLVTRRRAAAVKRNHAPGVQWCRPVGGVLPYEPTEWANVKDVESSKPAAKKGAVSSDKS